MDDVSRFLQRVAQRLPAAAPQPEAIDRRQTVRHALVIDRVSVKHHLDLIQSALPKHGIRALWQGFPDVPGRSGGRKLCVRFDIQPQQPALRRDRDETQPIAGELPDASEVDGPDIEPDGAGFRVSGALNLALLRSRIGLQAQATEDYQTLAGLVMSLLDRLPVVGDEVEFAGWRMRVEEVHERRVNRLLLVQVQA